MSINENFRRWTAPLILRLGAKIVRSRLLGTQMTIHLWSLLDRHFSYLGGSFPARIVSGQTMTVSTRSRVENEIFFCGEWEPILTRYIMKTQPSDGIFVDVGANIGYFTLLASRVFAHVHAIEASPSIGLRLRENVARNGVRNVTIHNIAVGRASGAAAFYLDIGQSGGSSLYQSKSSVIEAIVPVEPLEVILGDIDLSRVQFIKIDVEGSEPDVLESALRLKDRFGPELEIMVEFHPHSPRITELTNVIRRFVHEGYTLHRLQGAYSRHEYIDRSLETAMSDLGALPADFCDIILRGPRFSSAVART